MKRKFILTVVFTVFFIACAFLSGILAQTLADYARWLKDGTRGMYTITIDYTLENLIKSSLTKPGLVILAVLFTLSGWLYYKYKTRLYSDGRNFNISGQGTYGTAGWMSLKEAKQVLEIGSIHHTQGILFGHIAGEAVSLPHDTYNNRHVAVYGASGSMKSRAFVRNNILQLALLGKSMILTDPKGELFADTAEFLKKMGYTVRLFNLVRPELSDRWNCLAEINSDELMAQTFSDVVIANTNTGRKPGGDPFWDRAEMNLLKALVLYVDSKKIKSSKTMKQLYAILACGSNTKLMKSSPLCR